MGEKLTPLQAHLMRRRVPVYPVNSRSHTQVANRVLLARVGVRVDVGIVWTPALMACHSTGATPIPATFGCLRTAQSLNISRAMRESSRYSLRAGYWRRAGRASSLDVANAALTLAPMARITSPASAGLHRLQRQCRRGGEQHLLFGDQDGRARRCLGDLGGCPTTSGATSNDVSNSDISVLPWLVVVPGR